MRRIFLIGNGPSLNVTPLDLLIGEDSFALNRIHLIYPKTHWHPTYFWYVDHPTNDAVWREPIDANIEIAKHVWLLDEYRTGIPDGHHGNDELPPHRALGESYHTDKVTWVPRCQHQWMQNNRKAKEWHLPTYCTAYNGMYGMYQAAVEMGYEEIYLVGCDLGYTWKYGENHFAGNYATSFIPDLREPLKTALLAMWADDNNKGAMNAHTLAKIECDKRGVKIYNATIGGELEIFPRVKLEDVLNAK